MPQSKINLGKYGRNLDTKDKEVEFLILIIEYRRLSFV